MNVDNPDPPESLPAYITDGVPKQDTESLRELQDWIDQLIQYRNNLSGDEIGADADQDEKRERINNSGDTTTVIKKVPRGKDACSNCPHGPYRYEVHRQRSWFGIITDLSTIKQARGSVSSVIWSLHFLVKPPPCLASATMTICHGTRET